MSGGRRAARPHDTERPGGQNEESGKTSERSHVESRKNYCPRKARRKAKEERRTRKVGFADDAFQLHSLVAYFYQRGIGEADFRVLGDLLFSCSSRSSWISNSWKFKCPAIHVRPLRGLSTLSSCYPRSLTVVVACFAAPPRPLDDPGLFMV